MLLHIASLTFFWGVLAFSVGVIVKTIKEA